MSQTHEPGALLEPQPDRARSPVARPICETLAGSITQVEGIPGRFHVTNHAGTDVTPTSGVDLASAFRMLDALAQARRSRHTRKPGH